MSAISLQGWVVSESGDGTGAVVINTQNGGHTWHGITFNKSQPLPSNFINGSHGWVALAQGAGMMHEQLTILHTQDAGAHWVTVTQTPTSDTGFSINTVQQLDFVSSEIGWAVVNKELYKTSDGGRHWTHL